jgi:GTP pyrophosphokinase/guanosine-3',5'-bis(diphosphate) 3'-pyrophosphohydrolase
VAVAKILTELKLDSATITTGLLHDTIEDTNVTYETVKKEFGEEVANLVEGVTKISALEDKASSDSKAENFRKLILATSKDIRVLLVKLADRLHNMRTIQFVKNKDKIIRKAKETMEIYAPLADRMGMNRIRDELEDLSFSVLNKPARDLILERLNFIKNNTDDTFKSISQELIEILKNNGITATITGREKTPFSIWRKIQNKKISLEQRTDIIGFRVIVNNIEDCYKTLGIFHNRFSTIPGKFKDYISTPKINNYKSIHTAVVGPKKNRIEIQIRTHDMHEFAQRGIASHWKYKSSEKFSELSWKEYDWLRDLVEIIEAGTSPEHYYEFTKLQMFQENVFCFTPNGAVIKLPQKATPIDFAYAVHTKVGNSAIGCTVNGRHATLQTILKNGDLVNIETSKNASPSLHWLSSSTTGKARSAIRRYWQDKSTEGSKIAEKNYSSTIEVDLPHKPGVLGHITSLIGLNKGNIVNLEIIKRTKEHLTFSFDLQIKDLKNFTNLISQIKQSNLRFKIIRHKQKKNAFIRRIFKNFKRN